MEDCVNTDNSFSSQRVLEQSYKGEMGSGEQTVNVRTGCFQKAEETRKAINLLRKRKKS